MYLIPYIVAFFIICCFFVGFSYFSKRKHRSKTERIPKYVAVGRSKAIALELNNKCPDKIIDETFAKINQEVNLGNDFVDVKHHFDNYYQKKDFENIINIQYGYSIDSEEDGPFSITYRIAWK